MHLNTLHGAHWIQSQWMESTHSIEMLWAMLHKIHCIQSGCIGPCCIKCTAFHHAAWNPLHSIGFHFFTLHGINWILTQCMEFTAFTRDAFYHAAWSNLNSITMHGIHCIQSGCFGPCCIKSTALKTCCMESTAFNWDALGHAAYNPVHSIGMHLASLHWLHCIQ